jgi:hypothetical protein
MGAINHQNIANPWLFANMGPVVHYPSRSPEVDDKLILVFNGFHVESEDIKGFLSGETLSLLSMGYGLQCNLNIPIPTNQARNGSSVGASQTGSPPPSSSSPPKTSKTSKTSREGQYGLVDKTHPSCVRPGFNTRVQH